MNLDPSLIRQSMDMMKNMSPEQLQSMSETSKRMQANGMFPKAPGAGFNPTYTPPPAVSTPKKVP